MLIDLDDRAGVEPDVVGAKAAWLARGRRAGLPVLPGFVVPAEAATNALAAGARALDRRGSGGARLEVAARELDAALEAALPAASARLGPRLVVRSSSPLEDDAAWAGAFTSYLDVTAEELPTAIRGCWASVYSNGAIGRATAMGRDPAGTPLAVLVQPALTPIAGGSARLADGRVVIVAVAGSPAPLMQGWDPGMIGAVDADGVIVGKPLLELLGAAALREVASAVQEAARALGATGIEWAIDRRGLAILQLGREEPVTKTPAGDGAWTVVPVGTDLPLLERIARLVRRWPGHLGEILVLPWSLGAGWPGPIGGDDSGRAPAPDPATEAIAPANALRGALALAADLSAAAWGLPGDTAAARAAAVLDELRGPDPGAAARRLAALPRPDPALAAQLVALLDRGRWGLIAAGIVAHRDDTWHMTPGEAIASLESPGATTTGRPTRRLDRWMPLQAAVILAAGRHLTGIASSPGLGAGRLCLVDDVRWPDHVRPGDVIMAPRPLPHLAPLLWEAAGVVTAGGGPGAHLFGSARALGLPGVSGIGLDDVMSEIMAPDGQPWAVAVDGSTGIVAVTPW